MTLISKSLQTRLIRVFLLLICGVPIPAVGQAPQVPLADRHEELSQAALAGDTDAALTLGLQLQTCFENKHVLTERAVSVALENARSASTEFARDIHLDNANKYQRLAALCAGLTETDFKSGIEWIFLAAESGNEAALTLIDQTVRTRINHDSDKFPEYAAQAVKLLKTDVDRGNPRHTLTLANVYRNGLIVERDPVLAAAYAYAYELVGEQATGSLALNSIIDRHALLDHEVEQAMVMGRQIAECCKAAGR